MRQNKLTSANLKGANLNSYWSSNDKMDVIVQCRGMFYKFGCSGKDYVEAFNFCVHITKDMKNAKEFKETTRSLFLLFFLSPFYLALRPTATLRSQSGEQLRRLT